MKIHARALPPPKRTLRPASPLPTWILEWPPEAVEDLHEREGIVADACRLPQRCEEVERLAEAIVRHDWATYPKEIDQ